jgi:tetratricopeptide (TPR) repeat protein
MKDYNGSIDASSKAIKLNPNYGAAYLNRGTAKEMVRDQIGACDDWDKAFKLGMIQAKNYLSECVQK